jgi:hypothetical protein
MLESLNINGYLGIESLELRDLKRVTLLVGKNNCGKTSLLEAIQLGVSDSPFEEMVKIAQRRSEIVDNDELFPQRIFRNHELRIDTPVTIQLRGTPQRTRSIKFKIIRAQQKLFPELDPADDADSESLDDHESERVPVIEISSSDDLKPVRMTLTESLSLSRRMYRRIAPGFGQKGARPFFLGTESLSSGEMGELWGKLVLGESEPIILQALKGLEPRLERLAFVPDSIRGNGHFKIKLKDQKDAVPLGSMGDGMRRFLALAFAMRNSVNGVFLIDEIDTGLHYSVMLDMWRFVVNAARDLNMQVFATTHSQDCIDSLAEFITNDPDLQEEFSLQRIEIGSPAGIPYSAKDIQLCVSRRIEMR